MFTTLANCYQHVEGVTQCGALLRAFVKNVSSIEYDLSTDDPS